MKIFFDGGCHPNPGPIETAVVIAGKAYVRDDLAPGDNNEAEWQALLHALDLAIAADAQDVVFLGDSTLVIEQAAGHWPCRSPQLRTYLAEFRERSPAIARIRFRQVRRAKNLAGFVLAQRRQRAD